MRRPIVVLGATGSIGTQTLDILQFSLEYELIGISFNSQYEKLEKYLFYFDSLKFVAISDKDAALRFKKIHPAYTVFSGEDSSLELLKECKNADVFNSLMGNVGLRPTLLAIRQNQDIFLSNKESLVIGSSLIKRELENSNSHIYPVDSEHVALAKLIKECKRRNISDDFIMNYIVTASGGSLRDLTKEELKYVTPKQVLSHPTWSMGSKITCDSATLVNKGYEVIEASVLFDVSLEKVSAIICRESLVHARVIYKNGNNKITLDEYSPCSMKVPITYALSKGELSMHKNNSEDEINMKKLHFDTIDEEFYPAFRFTIDTYKKYGNVGMIFYNAVDTRAITCFLNNEITYLQLIDCLRYTNTHLKDLPSLEEDILNEIIHDADNYALDVINIIKEA